MVTEKVKAAGEAAMTIAMGGTPRKVVRGYRRAGGAMRTAGRSRDSKWRPCVVKDRSENARAPTDREAVGSKE